MQMGKYGLCAEVRNDFRLMGSAVSLGRSRVGWQGTCGRHQRTWRNLTSFSGKWETTGVLESPEGKDANVLEKFHLYGAVRKRKEKMESQWNIFQNSKNREVCVLGLQKLERIFRGHGFLNFKTAISC